MTFSDRFKQVVTQRYPGYTQIQLGKKLGVSNVTVSQWLAGDRLPSSSAMINLSIVLGVDHNWLVTGRTDHVYIGDLTEAEQDAVRRIVNALRSQQPEIKQ